jgi:hypothetical protein
MRNTRSSDGSIAAKCFRLRVPGRLLIQGGFVLLTTLALQAADVDVSKLPPAATVKIDFARDIRPIIETSCLRCHGPDKPKSHFRLDNRESALKGGENGVDILPGQSAKSPLIHYTSRLVADMEMPPEGKGDPLTARQVGLLRAWIDQGAVWSTGGSTNNRSFEISTTFGGVAVKGDASKFRELNWEKTGLNGGAEHFDWFDHSDPNVKVHFFGHALADDYQLQLNVDQNDFGFVHAGWQQFRKYYDDVGGLWPSSSTPSALSLRQDLYLDVGKAWVDFGLTLPKLPRMVLGYEYDYKQGDESVTAWGAAGKGGNARNIAPNSKSLQEGAHVLKFDLDADVHGVAVEDRFRGEFYNLDTHYTNSAARGPVGQNVSEGTRYFEGANTFRLEKTIYPWWTASGGYLYSSLNSDGTFSDTVTELGSAHLAAIPNITLERQAHVFNANSIFGPVSGFSITGGVQSEWTHEQGFGSGKANRLPFTFFAPLDLGVNPVVLTSDHDEHDLTETLALRFTKIPFSILFADLRFEQQQIGQSENDSQATGSYLDNISYTSQLSDIRFGMNTSPWKIVSFNAQYHRYENDSHYNNDTVTFPLGGYPGFIRSRDLLTDELEAKLVIHPAPWIKTTLSWQYLTTQYRTDTEPARAANVARTILTPGGPIISGDYASHIYSINTSVTPMRKIFLNAGFSWQPTALTTADNGINTIVPYRGDIYSVLANGTYALSRKTDLFAGYSFSTANYGQQNLTVGVPVGIIYHEKGAQAGVTHRFTKNISAQLRYGYYRYREPSSGGASDFTANSIFATVMFKLP